jgi:hypothetical protein
MPNSNNKGFQEKEELMKTAGSPLSELPARYGGRGLF